MYMFYSMDCPFLVRKNGKVHTNDFFKLVTHKKIGKSISKLKKQDRITGKQIGFTKNR